MRIQVHHAAVDCWSALNRRPWRRQVKALLVVGLTSLGLCASLAAAPDPETPFVAEVWQVTEGLPDLEVTSIAQTPDGYLWVGTRGGLARFDGMRFEIFRANVPGLEGRHVAKVFVDPSGALWVSMASGQLSRYSEGRFVGFRSGDGWSMRPVVSASANVNRDPVLVDAAGEAWVFARDRFRKAFHDGSEPSGLLQTWVRDRSGSEWALDRTQQLRRFQGNAWERVAPSQGEAAESVLTLAPARAGGVWVVDRTTLRRLEADRRVVEVGSAPLNLDAVSAMAEDDSGGVWLGTVDSRLYRMMETPAGPVWRPQAGLPPGPIHELFTDREGNLWVAIGGGGLVRLHPAAFRTHGMAEGLPSQAITAAAEASLGLIMVGTQGGGLSLLEGGLFFGPVSMLGRAVTVNALLPAHGGGVWVGTEGEGLFRLHGAKSARWTAEAGLTDRSIRALYQDRKDALWIGTDSAVFRFDGSRFVRLGTSDGLAEGPVQAITQDLQGDVWIGTANGLSRVRDGKVSPTPGASALVGSSIRSLLPGGAGQLWIGTQDGGLLRFKEGGLVPFTTRNGLPDDSINSLLESGGSLWMGTDNGVFRVAVTELEAVAEGRKVRVEGTPFEVRDGLASQQCPAGSSTAIQTGDGALWFATAHAMNRVDPSQLATNSVPPAVLVERMTVDGEDAFTNRRNSGNAPDGPSLRVPAGRRHLEITYTALDLTRPTQTRFKIRLEGAENVEREVGNRRVAFYDGLPPGTYRFHVTAATRDGVWNSTPASIDFVVSSFYWETWWFRGGTGLALLVGGVALGRRYIVRREREKVARTLHLQGVALASAGDGIVIFEPDGTMVWVNEAFTRLTGYGGEEVVGRNIVTLNSGSQTPGDYRVMWDTLADGKPWQTEIEKRNRNGSLSIYERTMTPVRDAQGGITHFVAIYRDISQRKRMELALGESEERFRTLAQSTLEAILIYDADAILEVNRAAVEVFGYSESELVGRSLLELIDGSDRARAIAHFESLQDAACELRGLRKDGRKLDLEIHCRPCPFRGRSVRVAAARDVTEARLVQQRIQSLTQQKALETERTRIARDMHDEMGSSLTRITLLSEAAELGMESPDPADRAGARTRLQRISALGRSLVVSMDEIVWAVNPVNDTLEECASYLCHVAPELLKTAGIQCRLTVPEVFPSRQVSSEVRHHLFLVVKESLHNVMKHSGAGTVSLSMDIRGDEFWLVVADDGRGFDPAVLSRRGNGLINMRQRMESVGGGWDLESRPGEGTRMTIHLPVPPKVTD